MRFKATVRIPDSKKPEQIFAASRSSMRAALDAYPEGSKVMVYEQQDVLIEAYTVERHEAHVGAEFQSLVNSES